MIFYNSFSPGVDAKGYQAGTLPLSSIPSPTTAVLWETLSQ